MGCLLSKENTNYKSDTAPNNKSSHTNGQPLLHSNGTNATSSASQPPPQKEIKQLQAEVQRQQDPNL